MEIMQAFTLLKTNFGNSLSSEIPPWCLETCVQSRKERKCVNFNTFGDGGQKISDQQSSMFMHRNLGKSGIYAVYQFRGVLLEDFSSQNKQCSSCFYLLLASLCLCLLYVLPSTCMLVYGWRLHRNHPRCKFLGLHQCLDTVKIAIV